MITIESKNIKHNGSKNVETTKTMMKTTSLKLRLSSAFAGIALLAAGSGAWAQVDAVTSTPTRIYTTPGSAFSFVVNYTGPETAATDLAVTYTANTTSPVLTPNPAATCISPATPAPYTSAQPNEFYVLFEPAAGTYPLNCGGVGVATPMATFNGVATTIPGGGYVIRVLNNAAAGAPNLTTNDVAICQKPTVNSVVAPAPAAEGTSQVFTVNFTPALAAACAGLTIPVTLTGGAGVAAAIGANTCAAVPAGVGSCTVTITSTDNNVAQGDQPITVAVTDSTAASSYISAGKSANGVIQDNETSISVALGRNGAEGGLSVQFAITCVRGSAAAAPAAANVALVFGGAAPAAVAADFTVAFPANQALVCTTGAGTVTTIDLPVFDDALVEGTENLSLTISTATANAVVNTATANATVADNDTPPSISVSAKTDGGEPATNGSFTLTRTGNPTSAVPVQVTVAGTATRGTDYFLSTGACLPGNTIPGNTITIPAAALSLTVGICVIDDVTVEGTETVILTVATPALPTDYTIGAPATQTANITDDDGPTTVTIVATTPNAAEPATNGLFTVSRSGGGAAQLALPLVVNLTISGTATNGTDYANIPATVTIPANLTTVTVPVTVIDDTAFEGNETVIATIGAGGYTVGGASTATVTIADNEVGLGVAATTANTIEGGNLAFTITCSTNVGTFNVNYAFSGTYAPLPANGTNVAIPCATGLVVNVPTIDDTVQNGTRTVTLTLTAASPAPGSVDPARAAAVGNVLDNDLPRIIPTMSPLGMILMGLLLAGAAAFGIRRKG